MGNVKTNKERALDLVREVLNAIHEDGEEINICVNSQKLEIALLVISEI